MLFTSRSCGTREKYGALQMAFSVELFTWHLLVVVYIRLILIL